MFNHVTVRFTQVNDAKYNNNNNNNNEYIFVHNYNRFIIFFHVIFYSNELNSQISWRSKQKKIPKAVGSCSNSLYTTL